jgi:hypothetical protein
MINLVDINYLDKIINKEINRPGRFISFEGNVWIAVDNTTDDAWTETFESPVLATQWLVNEDIDAEDLRQHHRIKKAFQRDILVNI